MFDVVGLFEAWGQFGFSPKNMFDLFIVVILVGRKGRTVDFEGFFILEGGDGEEDVKDGFQIQTVNDGFPQLRINFTEFSLVGFTVIIRSIVGLNNL